ncbi:uncharacterized protein LOC8268287 isoform X1 [Ricinus communis]|uniref:uncharacterized protein LOC8268287 isoform X1 n=1 Tax=Ricinus communis TaxID=3988 RepID=UPI00077224B6|nr:uncharacterized protein LOC8268287 isoform X1 [Ricinus communis]|eukprot:XP_015582786.1 uncharacterized protein LOC8268287 isoform X1 [Ricinus communis]
MGKNLQHSNSPISIQNSGPGCMWGVLHILKYHHWRYIKKRLPYRRPVNGKNAMGVGNPGYDTKASKSDRMFHRGSSGDDSLTVNEKMTQSTPVTNNSVRSRLKSLIIEELYRMKGRHRQTSSHPVQSPLMRTDSIHRLEPADKDPHAGITLNNESPLTAKNLNNGSPAISDNQNFSAPSLLDPLVPNSSEDQSSDDYSTILTRNNSDIDANHFFSEGNSGNQDLVHAQELNADASTWQSNEFMDALDIINLNKEFFMKVLQEPGSPFAHHFHSRRALSSKLAYSKSLSFSSSSSSSMRGSGPRKVKANELIESHAVESKSKEYIRSNSMPSIPAEYQTSHHRKNQAVIKRFKNLKNKIKHVIRRSKNEKHRIAMDGILHKIPHGQELPKDVKSENHSANRDDNESPRSSCESHNSLLSTSKTGSHCFSRTSSLCESLDRYCQLYEFSCKGDAKHHCFEPLKLTEDSPQESASKSMGRLFSSPDLKSHFCYDEDSSDAFPLSQVRNAADATVSTRSDFSEQSDAESHIKSDIQQNLDSNTVPVGDRQETVTVSNVKGDAKLDVISDDLEESCNKQDTEPSGSESNSVPVSGIKFQEDHTTPVSLSSAEEADLKLTISLPLPEEINCWEDQVAATIIKDVPAVAESGIEKIEVPSKQIQFQVGAKDKAEFDYVKDILELSGFTKNELLGTWHSDDQPVDPSLFEEVAGCMFLDPECSGTEEGYLCYHLLLFDLINEVLMETYARSYTYYPMPLSTLSHIRPMPVGYHVLEEVWTNISWYLSSIPEPDQLLDHIVSRDLAKSDGWMNLQFDSECVGLEVEDIIFYDLLEEVIFS